MLQIKREKQYWFVIFHTKKDYDIIVFSSPPIVLFVIFHTKKDYDKSMSNIRLVACAVIFHTKKD